MPIKVDEWSDDPAWQADVFGSDPYVPGLAANRAMITMGAQQSLKDGLVPAIPDVSVDDGGVRGDASLSFQIQEFRRPEFEVVTRAESAGPHLLTQPVTVAALAQYFSGGVLTDAPTVWQVTTSSATYAPPNWSQFTFGESRPYWLDNFGPDQFGGPIAFSRGGMEPPCCFPVRLGHNTILQLS